MRSVLALGLLIALCTSANAARVHRSQPQPQQVTVRPDPYAVPVYGSPEWERLHRLNTPSYDDPSKRSPGG
jgi:poly-D-alanine transfer protein DltD